MNSNKQSAEELNPSLGGEPGVARTLRELSDTYRHFEQEHAREGADGSFRRRLERKLRQTAVRFEALTEHWLDDEEQRKDWRRFFYHGGAVPFMPRTSAPPLFKGRSTVGAAVEVRPREGDGIDVFVDDVLELHDDAPWGVPAGAAGLFEIVEHQCRESFDVPAEAIDALREFLASSQQEPPWRWAKVLYLEGLVDERFSLTLRGARALRYPEPQQMLPAAGLTYGVVAANAAGARFFLLSTAQGESESTVFPLLEFERLARPSARVSESQAFSETRPGLRRGAGGTSAHGVDDHRQAHRINEEKRFVSEVTTEVLRLWTAQGVERAIIAASPRVLGLVRQSLFQKGTAQAPWLLNELDRDLTHLSAARLHDALAAVGLLPLRGRLTPRPLKSSGSQRYV